MAAERRIRVARIYEGADEVNLAGIARNLFKRNATSVNSSELLFFLTPRIIPSA